MKIIFRTPILYLFMILMLLTGEVSAKDLFIISLDMYNYPVIRASILVLDENDKIITPEAGDIEIRENGKIVPVDSIICPPRESPRPMSSVLTIDESGSMQEIADKTQPMSSIEIAREAAGAWVDIMPEGYECAVTGFDHLNVLKQDFTTDKENLRYALENLYARGGTDFNAALINESAGALLIAENAKYKPVIILLTDGMGQVNSKAIIKKANELNASINIVTIYNNTPSELITIANLTGGYYFDRIRNAEQAKDAYEKLFMISQGVYPCNLYWYSDQCWNDINLEISIPKYGLKKEINYQSSNSELFSRIDVYPETFNFGKVYPGNTAEHEFTLKAMQSDVMINKIESSGKEFDISDYGGSEPPFLLKKYQTRKITIAFKPETKGYTFTKIEIESDACLTGSFYVKGGSPDSSIGVNKFRVSFPNGGETLIAGTDTNITWEGLSYTDTVKLELSTDNGRKWRPVTFGGTEWKYKWKIPNTPSDSCLIRGSHFVPAVSDTELTPISNRSTDVEWSPDLSQFAATFANKMLKIWDTKTKTLIKTYDNFDFTLNGLTWSPDGKKIAVSGRSSNILIINLKDNSMDTLYGEELFSVQGIEWSPDGKYIAGRKSGGGLYIWKTDDKSLYYNIYGNSFYEYSLAWSPDSKKLAFGTDMGNLNVMDVPKKQILYTSFSGFDYFLSLDWSPNSRLLLATMHNMITKIINADNGIQIKEFGSLRKVVNSAKWSRDGSKFACATAAGKIIIFEYDFYNKIIEFDAHDANGVINHIDVDSTCMNIISSGDDGKVKFWEIGHTYGTDESDSLWRIIAPEVETSDIDMGKSLVNAAKDSIIRGFIKNTGTVPVRIDTIIVEAADSAEFRLLSGWFPVTIEPGKSHDIEFGFLPFKEGPMKGRVIVKAQHDSIISGITGTGVKNKISIISSYINFGKVYVSKTKNVKKYLLKNTSEEDLKIDSVMMLGPDNRHFRIISGTGSFILAKGDSISLEVQFAPEEKGRTQGSLGFFYNSFGAPAICSLIGEGIGECDETAFNYDDFKKQDGFILRGSAKVLNRELRLTGTEPNCAGAVWHGSLIPVKKGFVTAFMMRLSNGSNLDASDNSSPGADGFALVIQNAGTGLIGKSGGGLGYDGIPECIAIEFDLFANNGSQIENLNDPNGNHIAVQANGSDPDISGHGEPQTLALWTDIPELRADGTTYYIMVDYNIKPDMLRIFIDTEQNFLHPTVFLDSLDISRYINLDHEEGAYIGITASTGSSVENHDLTGWWACPTESDGPFTSADDDREIVIENDKSGFTIYPNPAAGNFLIISHSDIREISIYDVPGRLVYAEKLQGSDDSSIEIDCSGWQPGIYQCRIKSDKGIESRLLIIE